MSIHETSQQTLSPGVPCYIALLIFNFFLIISLHIAEAYLELIIQPVLTWKSG